MGRTYIYSMQRQQSHHIINFWGSARVLRVSSVVHATVDLLIPQVATKENKINKILESETATFALQSFYLRRTDRIHSITNSNHRDDGIQQNRGKNELGDAGKRNGASRGEGGVETRDEERM